MEEPRISETTREKIEEATVSVFMDQYAKALDAGIDKKIEECTDNDFPPELEKRCRALIEKEYAKERSKKSRKVALRVLRSAAAVVIVALGLCSVLFVTVEAFRVPIMNFFIEKTERYWELSGITDSNIDLEQLNLENPLEGIIPKEFYLVDLSGTWDQGCINALYSNENEETIFFSISPAVGSIQIDTEDARTRRCEIMGHDAICTVEGNSIQLTWLDETCSQIFLICTTNIPESKVVAWAEVIATIIN